MIIFEFTEEELDLIMDYIQDPSGTGPSSRMDHHLTENNLWGVYAGVMAKLEEAKEKQDPFKYLDRRVFALPPWYMREPWITAWLLIMALLAGFKVADYLASLVRWAF